MAVNDGLSKENGTRKLATDRKERKDYKLCLITRLFFFLTFASLHYRTSCKTVKNDIIDYKLRLITRPFFVFRFFSFFFLFFF